MIPRKKIKTAPSFQVARQELFKCLDEWVFARVLRPCTVPVKDGDYFHGTAIIENTETRTRVWFKKLNHDPPVVFIGPIRVEATSTTMPQAGDVIMGKLAKEAKEGAKFTVWYPCVNHLFVLRSVVCTGTTLSEDALCRELQPNRHRKTFSAALPPKGDQDTWALARLVLFGNVEAFTTCSMNLSYPGLEFVYRCSVFFGDNAMWDRFKQLVPDAEPPMEEGCNDTNDEDDDESSCLTNDEDVVVRRAPPLPPPSAQPVSPVFTPASPPYCPTTPPRSDSPVFLATTPPPTTPPPYDPCSPGYNSTSACYDPCSPAYSAYTTTYNVPPAPPKILSLEDIQKIINEVQNLKKQ